MALLTRMTRSTMIEVLGEDYIRTARAKGLGTSAVLLRHALKNAAVPIVTTIGTGIALLIGGVVVTESVFAIPGIGRLTIDAVTQRDYPVIQGVILVSSFAYVAVNLLIDLSYGLFDPRIRTTSMTDVSIPAATTGWSDALRRARRFTLRNLTILIGGTLLVVLVTVSLAAPWIAHYDPLALNLPHRFRAPDAVHWFGTDNYGRDVFSARSMAGVSRFSSRSRSRSCPA